VSDVVDLHLNLFRLYSPSCFILQTKDGFFFVQSRHVFEYGIDSDVAPIVSSSIRVLVFDKFLAEIMPC
jgi:hypothetical protein